MRCKLNYAFQKLRTIILLLKHEPIKFTHNRYSSIHFQTSVSVVNIVIPDHKIPRSVDGTTISSYMADMVSATDYYPFGMVMAERNFGGGYRFGFNGKENDDEVKTDANGNPIKGSQQDYGMRIYDPRIAKFLSVDPITKDFPELTPFQFASNTPIQAIDLDGLEACEAGKDNADKRSPEEKLSDWLFNTTLDEKFMDLLGNDFQTVLDYNESNSKIGFSEGTTATLRLAINLVLLGEGLGTVKVKAPLKTNTPVITRSTAAIKEVEAVETQKNVTQKLDSYLLNKSHPVGRDKAIWFEKSLGFNKNNAGDLAKQIQFDPQKAIFQKNNGYADLYQQIIPIKGANGKIIDVPFNWAIDNGETVPHLVGAIPVKPQ